MLQPEGGVRPRPSAARFSLAAKWIVVAIISVVFGNVCYEVFVAALGDHFHRFSYQNQTILDGHSIQYVFQQRILPSYEINLIERMFHVDNTTANLIYYRSFFVLTSVLATAMSVAAGSDARRATLMTGVFSVSNIFVIVAGYWLMAFDLQNLACIQVLFIVFFAPLSKVMRIVLLVPLAVVWQFTLEEVIYIPIFWLLYSNAPSLAALRWKAIFGSLENWLLAATIPASLVFANLTRQWLLVGTDVRGSETQVMSQDLQVATNLSTMLKQLAVTFHPLHTLREDYWMQGGGLYLALNICAFCLVSSMQATLKDPLKLAVVLMFVCMSAVTLLFAHLEEANTMMPMMVNVIAIHLSQASSSRTGRRTLPSLYGRQIGTLQAYGEPARSAPSRVGT